MATALTADELVALLTGRWGAEFTQDITPKFNRWLKRGDGIAVYVNQDLGHPERGDLKVISYGSPAAQVEAGEPPVTLPGIGGEVNWRYQLSGTYRGEPLPCTPPVELTEDDLKEEWDEDDDAADEHDEDNEHFEGDGHDECEGLS